MKIKNVAIILSLLVLSVLIFISIRGIFFPNQKQSGIVFIAPEKYKTTFEQSADSGKLFYDLYGKAKESIKTNDYESAIMYLNRSLEYVGMGLEKGMVYSKLAEIYKTQGNLEKELFYVQQIPQYTLNEKINEEAKHRVAEIRSLLARKETAR